MDGKIHRYGYEERENKYNTQAKVNKHAITQGFRERERERETETKRETDRVRERERER